MNIIPMLNSPPIRPLAEGASGAIGWSLVLIAFVIAAFYAVMRLRRWLNEEDLPGSGMGFTLSDLRRLHREGKMTADEYERARSKMVAAGKAMAEKLPDPLSGRRAGAAPAPKGTDLEQRPPEQ